MNQTVKKRGGRKKGTPNAVTTSLRHRIDMFISRNFDGIQKEYESLSAKDKLNFISQLFAFAVPKLSSSSNEVNIKTKLEELSDPQLQKVIDQILAENEV